MTDSMIERIARRLCELKMVDPDQEVAVRGSSGAAHSIPLWDAETPVARAILAAMRDPTDGMLDRTGWPAESAAGYVARDRDRYERQEVWQGLIDAALAEDGG